MTKIATRNFYFRTASPSESRANLLMARRERVARARRVLAACRRNKRSSEETRRAQEELSAALDRLAET